MACTTGHFVFVLSLDNESSCQGDRCVARRKKELRTYALILRYESQYVENATHSVFAPLAFWPEDRNATKLPCNAQASPKDTKGASRKHGNQSCSICYCSISYTPEFVRG